MTCVYRKMVILAVMNKKQKRDYDRYPDVGIHAKKSSTIKLNYFEK